MRVGILVAFTSKTCNYKSQDEFVAYASLLPSLLRTMCAEHNVTVYFGYDAGDPFVESLVPDNPEASRLQFELHVRQWVAKRSTSSTPCKLNVQVHRIQNPHMSSPCFAWNALFEIAIQDKCDYVLQCVDDIIIHNAEWLQLFIAELRKHDNIGLVGGYSRNGRIITQAFVSHKHCDIFGYLFHPEFNTWWSDDWINEVYMPARRYWLKHVVMTNAVCYAGDAKGASRYIVDRTDKDKLAPLVKMGQELVAAYIAKNK